MSDKGFSIGDIFANVPNAGTPAGQEQITYIDEHLLQEDGNNFYSIDGIDELASNIELVGLQQPLRVRPDPEDEGAYLIVSGHRRLTAIRTILKKDDPERWAKIPCIIEDHPQESDAMRELRLIFANSDTRKMSGADIDKQAQRVQELLYQLKKEGVEFPGRMRDYVAEACKVSKSKLSRLKVIREGLTQSDYRQLWERGKLDEAVAYELARFSPDMQERIWAAKKTDVKSWNLKRVLEEVERTGKEYASCSVSCKAHNPCLHNIRVLAHDLAGYSLCGTSKCCMKCDEGGEKRLGSYGSVCQYACAEAKKEYEQRKLAAKEKQLSEDEIKVAENKKVLQAQAKRYAAAIRQSGAKLSDRSVVSYSCHSTNADILRWADGDIPDDLYCVRATEDGDMTPLWVSTLVEAADAYGCSTDYLLGRSDALNAPLPTGQLMISGWMPGGTTPGHSCECVVDFCFEEDETEKTFRQFACWDSMGGRWTFKHGAAIEATPVRWLELPEVER